MIECPNCGSDDFETFEVSEAGSTRGMVHVVECPSCCAAFRVTVQVHELMILF